MIGVLGANFNKGQDKWGVRNGPCALREFGLVHRLKNISSVHDYGNKLVEKNEEQNYYELYQACKKSLLESSASLFLGGDHSVAISTIQAVKEVYPAAIVIWVDAHGDINTPKTSPSGNLHGMPLASLIGEFSLKTMNSDFYWTRACLHPRQDLLMMGLRDLDDGELKILRENKISWLSLNNLRASGVIKTLEHYLNQLDPWGVRPLHLSFDIDVMDPSVASATGLSVPKGMWASEAFEIAETLSKTKRLVSLDVVEVNPTVSHPVVEPLRTCRFANQFIVEALSFLRSESSYRAVVSPNEGHPKEDHAPLWSLN